MKDNKLTKNRIYKFSCLKFAENFAFNGEKLMGIVMGDDEMYWVVTMADFNRLVKSRYEAA